MSCQRRATRYRQGKLLLLLDLITDTFASVGLSMSGQGLSTCRRSGWTYRSSDMVNTVGSTKSGFDCGLEQV